MGSEISDWNKEGWGNIPMTLGFTYSSNTLMMHLQDLVGADKMKSWYERFGFGKKTDGMFDGEASGHVAWANELQQNICVWTIYDCYTCTDDSSTISIFQ